MPTPRYKPTEERRTEVLAYAAVGVPHAQIALLIGVNLRTLYKYYRHELDLGKARANYHIGKTLYSQAIKGNITAAIFWAKAQMGWREKQVIEHTGEGGGPVRTATVTATVSDEEAMRAYLKLVNG